MTPDILSLTLSIIAGICLSAAAGFRIFLPLFLASLCGYMGWFQPSSGLEWIASLPALIIFGIATFTEILAYCLPIVDHFLDLIGAPLATISGILLCAACLTSDTPELARWILALIAGGGMAFLSHLGTAKARLTSTLLTGGVANPIFAWIEAGISIALSLLALLLPIVALIILIFLLLILRRKMKWD